MRIILEKVTTTDLFRRACQMTTRADSSKVRLDRMYLAEHSPIRTQMFWVEMYDIPSFVSTHFVRHKFGVEHFVLSNREDRGGDHNTDRNTPVNHGMFLNAQALINMSRKRLCGQASQETQDVMQEIKRQVNEVDPDLALAMVPDCMYRGRCFELKPCRKRMDD